MQEHGAISRRQTWRSASGRARFAASIFGAVMCAGVSVGWAGTELAPSFGRQCGASRSEVRHAFEGQCRQVCSSMGGTPPWIPDLITTSLAEGQPVIVSAGRSLISRTCLPVVVCQCFHRHGALFSGAEKTGGCKQHAASSPSLLPVRQPESLSPRAVPVREPESLSPRRACRPGPCASDPVN